MKTSASLFSMTLLFLVGCSTTSQVVSEHQSLEAPGVSDARWVVSDGVSTSLLGQEGELLRQLSNVVLSSGGDLWFYNETRSQEPEADCGCYMEANTKGEDTSKCVGTATKSRAVFTRLRDAEVVYPFEVMSSPETESSMQFAMKGQWKNYVIVEACQNVYACGAAHPSSSCEAKLFDLETGELKSVATIVPEVDSAPAREEIIQKDPEFEGDLELGTAEVRVENGERLLRAHFFGGTCYACSDGEWGAYTMSGWADTGLREAVPAPLVDFAKKSGQPYLYWFEITDGVRPAVMATFETEAPQE